MGSTWILGDCLGGGGGGGFFKLKLICGDFVLEFSPRAKTFNYSGPPKQWVRTRIRKTLDIIQAHLINQVLTLINASHVPH